MKALGIFTVVGVLLVLTGCVGQVDKTTELFIKEIVRPTCERVATDTAAHAWQAQAGAEAINPGLVTEIDAVFGPGGHMRMSIRAEGLAGRGSFATQGEGDRLNTPMPATGPSGGN